MSINFRKKLFFLNALLTSQVKENDKQLKKNQQGLGIADDI